MDLFKITQTAKELKDNYFEPAKLKVILKSISGTEKNAFIHQWMTEGIPYCFKDCPMMFEFSRSWLSDKLQLHPKNITLIGSGRFGFSLAPSNFGKKFDENSDLDLSCISANLFNDIVGDYNLWYRDYKIYGILRPNQNDAERWDKNIDEVQRNIGRGFIDLNRIPTEDKYLKVRRTMRALEELQIIFKSRRILNVTKITLRIFKNWDSATIQFRLNLDYTIKDMN